MPAWVHSSTWKPPSRTPALDHAAMAGASVDSRIVHRTIQTVLRRGWKRTMAEGYHPAARAGVHSRASAIVRVQQARGGPVVTPAAPAP